MPLVYNDEGSVMSRQIERGKVVIYIGSMFSEKTTNLIRSLQLPQNQPAILLKALIDDRYATNYCVSHNGLRYPAINISHQSPQIVQTVQDYQLAHPGEVLRTVALDELNFFSFALIWEQIETLRARGINFYGAGLPLDTNKQPFGATLQLMDKADEVIQLYAICDGCGGPADLTYRKIPQEQQLAVGGSELYGACCAVCWENLHR
jgi:thymidine kinase